MVKTASQNMRLKQREIWLWIAPDGLSAIMCEHTSEVCIDYGPYETGINSPTELMEGI